MKLIYLIDANGNWKEDKVVPVNYQVKNNEVDSLTNPTPQGLNLPKWNGSIWVEGGEVIPELTKIKVFKKQQIIDNAKTLIASLTADYHPAEVATFTEKEQQAKKYNASKNNSDAESLILEAQTRGITVQKLVDSIIAKSTAFRNQSQTIFGKRGKLLDHLDAITTVSEATNSRGIT